MFLPSGEHLGPYLLTERVFLPSGEHLGRVLLTGRVFLQIDMRDGRSITKLWGCQESSESLFFLAYSAIRENRFSDFS